MKTISWKTKGGDYKFLKVKDVDVRNHRELEFHSAAALHIRDKDH